MEIHKSTAVLIVIIGNPGYESCKTVLDAVKEAVMRLVPSCRLYHTFAVRGIRQKTNGQKTNDVKEVLDQILKDGVLSLLVQPVYLMHGLEYGNIKKELRQYEHAFQRMVLGEPLLAAEADFDAVGKALAERTAGYDDQATAVCFVGHGNELDGSNVYAKMQQKLAAAGCKNYYIGTIKGEPSLQTMIKALHQAGSYQRVVLYPFMTAVGSHVYRDMAGVQSGSWKSVLEQEGYEVVCVLEGMGQIPKVQCVFAEHVKAGLAVLMTADGGAGQFLDGPAEAAKTNEEVLEKEKKNL